MNDEEVLFMGLGRDGVSHYRTYLPATRGGWDYVIQDIQSQVVHKEVRQYDHPVLINQMPFQPWQAEQILRMRQHGAAVVVNIDDSVRAVHRMGSGHGLSHGFTKDVVRLHDACIEESDYLIVSTEYLAEKYKRKKPLLCRNGLDLARYKLPAFPFPFDFTVGWAGGTGHALAMGSIIEPVRRFIMETEGAGLALVGDQVMAKEWNLPTSKIRMVDWCDLWMYPKYIAGFDVALAPSFANEFFLAKSPLRFYESGACGVAGIYDPLTYQEAGAAGQAMATNKSEWYDHLRILHENTETRLAMGDEAKAYVYEHVDMEKRVHEWDAAVQHILRDTGLRQPIPEDGAGMSEVLQAEVDETSP